MRSTSFIGGTLLLAISSATACGGARAQTEQAKHGERERISLEGCVGIAPGNKEYLLFKAIPRDSTASNRVPPGSWVRLTSSGVNLKDHVARRVVVQGVVEDTGENTLRTSASVGDLHAQFARSAPDAHTNPERAGPPSTVVPAGATANGLAPLIAVENVTKVADSCRGD